MFFIALVSPDFFDTDTFERNLPYGARHTPAKGGIHLFLDAIRARALQAPFAPVAGAAAMPDLDDVIFLEAAVSLSVPIVTGNPRHFPRPVVGSTPILSPAAFLARLG